jgi:hypothetical protein
MGIIKTLLLSIMIVMLLQIRIQNVSIENYILNWARSERVAIFLNKAADGGLKLAQDTINKGKTLFKSLTEPKGAAPREAKRF